MFHHFTGKLVTFYISYILKHADSLIVCRSLLLQAVGRVSALLQKVLCDTGWGLWGSAALTGTVGLPSSAFHTGLGRWCLCVPRVCRDTWTTSGAAAPGGHNAAVELLWLLGGSASSGLLSLAKHLHSQEGLSVCSNRSKVQDLVIICSNNALELQCLLTKLLHKRFFVI